MVRDVEAVFVALAEHREGIFVLCARVLRQVSGQMCLAQAKAQD